MKRIFIQVLGFVAIFVITYGTVTNPYTSNYIEGLKNGVTISTVSKPSNELYNEISTKAKEYEEEPQDAQVHKVWKAMPGYNGIKVDVEASYEKMKKEGAFNPKKLVFKEIPPKITLDDLPPSPIYKGHPDKKMVSFLVNVAWGNEYIPEMLKTLKKHGVKATFFLEGRWAKKNSELAKMIVDGGHEIGNHSYTHADMKVASESVIRKELEETNQVLEAITDKVPTWFAPPSGSYRDEVITIAAEYKLKTVMWSVDTVDWKDPNPVDMVQRVTSKAHPGALILMHPTSATAKGLDSLITQIKEKNYRIGDLSTMLSEKRVKEKQL